jgi:hypothetical protein
VISKAGFAISIAWGNRAKPDHELRCQRDSFHDLELATFAVWQLAKMLKTLKSDYQAAYHGEIDLDSE